MCFGLINRLFVSLLFISLTYLSAFAENSYDDKHIEVSLRMIGHQVLLNNQDSTSRVLPIKREGANYTIEFESAFGINPDELLMIVNQVIKDTKMTSGYILEVLSCGNNEVVYSYEMGSLDEIDIIPCSSRTLPKACYSIQFTLSEEDGVLNVDESTAGAKTESGRIVLISVAAVFLLVGGGFIYRQKTEKKADANPNILAFGKYYFDKQKTELIYDKERIELSNKEAELLLLLFQDVNQTVERDVILNKVWGDEGDYIGRTLDVFISKLRKKLEFDPSVKIVNIRGVGYKLVMDV